MVGFLSRLVEHWIGRHHVIHHIAFGNLFRSELRWGRQVHTVVVSQVIVAHNGGWLE